LGKNLSAVPTAPTLKDTVEGGAPSAPVAPVAVQGPVVVSNDAPMVASVPKEPEDGLLLNVVPAPLSVAVGKGNVESSSLSDNDSSNSGSEESEESDSGSDSGSGSDGSDSSSTTSNCGSHTEKPVKPSFPTGVGTAVVSTADLVDAASAASVAAAKVLGPELPSASLFEGPPEDTLLETYGPGKPEEADMRQRMRASWTLPMLFLRKRMMTLMKSRKMLMVMKKKKSRKALMALKKRRK